MAVKIEEKLKSFYDAVAACNRCGFCTSYCPTYIATGSESYSPRGRNQAFRALIENQFGRPHEVKDIIDTCLLCGECTSVCFSEVPTAQLMVEARSFINQRESLPFGLKFVLYKLLPNPSRLRFVLKLSFWGKKLGISWLLSKLQILPKFFPTLAAADRLVKKVSVRFLTDRRIAKPYKEEALEKKKLDILETQKKITDLKASGKKIPEKLVQQGQRRPQRPKFAFFPACGSQYLRPEIGVSTIKLLEKLNYDFMIPEVGCCGLPAASYGVTDQVRAFAKKNIQILENGGYEHFVADDSSCFSHIKDYPHYFKDDPEWASRASVISGKFQGFSEFLVNAGLLNELQKKQWNGGPVAFHDPCKAQYGQQSTHPPRQLLKAIKGLELMQVKDADQCCGGGGTYSFVHPELSQEVLKSKINNLIATRAKTIVTTSSSCLIQVAFGLREKHSRTEVLHLSEFLARVL